MFWFLLILAMIVGLITTKRVVFVVAFLALFLAIGIQRTFSEFDLAVGFDFQGTEVVETTEPCGKAIPLILDTDNQQAQLGGSVRRECLKTARSRVFEGAVALVVGLGGSAIAWRLIPGLSPTPIDEVLNPLPRPDRPPPPPRPSDSEKSGSGGV